MRAKVGGFNMRLWAIGIASGISGIFGFLAVEGRAAAAAPTTTASLSPQPGTLAAEADLRDAINDIEANKKSRPFSLELNPFVGVIASGVSGNVEYVPVRHLGFIASPRASLVAPSWVGEVGARYWTGSKRQAAGFFVGPSLVYGKTRGDALYGVALDCGVQTIFDSGITIGAGIGAQYVSGAVPNTALEVGALESDAKPAHNGYILPRLLFSVGYSL